MRRIGIIGGSGLYNLDQAEQLETVELTTPFGPPSSSYKVHHHPDGHDIVFLPRHGQNHQYLPSEINHRANIFGFKALGVSSIIGISAVGSLQPQYGLGDIVLLDQFYDRTKSATEHTFFGHGLVAHVSFADPVCKQLRQYLQEALNEICRQRRALEPDRAIHPGGTYVNMEGPAFSTRAESRSYKSAGFDVIGMTSMNEAKLAREAEICYACAAMVTDYDCWREEDEHVTGEMVLETLRANTAFAKELIHHIMASPPPDDSACSCRSALASAMVTSGPAIPDQLKRDLAPIIGKYL